MSWVTADGIIQKVTWTHTSRLNYSNCTWRRWIISIDEKLDRILLDLSQIKKHWKIVEDRETTISDFEESIANFEQFALDEKKLTKGTINNQKSIIRAFLSHSSGHINHDSVKSYLDLNEDEDWKSNQFILSV